MTSLVQKWQAIKKQEEELSEDESDEEDRAAKTEAQIEQWRQEQITRYLYCSFWEYFIQGRINQISNHLPLRIR